MECGSWCELVVLTGNGLEGAIKGAVIGGTGGAILGKMK